MDLMDYLGASPDPTVLRAVGAEVEREDRHSRITRRAKQDVGSGHSRLDARAQQEQGRRAKQVGAEGGKADAASWLVGGKRYTVSPG